jgi:hypothetical protein
MTEGPRLKPAGGGASSSSESGAAAAIPPAASSLSSSGSVSPIRSARRSACIDEGALSFVNTICSSYRDSPYKR